MPVPIIDADAEDGEVEAPRGFLSRCSGSSVSRDRLLDGLGSEEAHGLAFLRRVDR